MFENNEIFSTPRRIGFIFHNINIETAEKEIIKKGPKVSHAFDENNIPTIVGNGFAKSVNRNIDELITIGSGADKRLAYKQKIRPQLLSELAHLFWNLVFLRYKMRNQCIGKRNSKIYKADKMDLNYN